MRATTERVREWENLIRSHVALHDGGDHVHRTIIAFAKEQDASYAALEDRIEKATEMVEQLQVRFARHGAYDPAETCAAVLDVLRGVSR